MLIAKTNMVKSIQMEKLSITFYRLAHVPETVPRLVKELQSTDLILMENVVKQSDAVKVIRFMNDISREDPAALQYAQSVYDTMIEPVFVYNLVWHLRGSKKLFNIVDMRLDDDKAEEQFQEILGYNEFAEIMGRIQSNPKERYTLISEWAKKRSALLMDRDMLVVRQIETLLTNSKDEITQRIHQNGQYAIAVIVGFVHKSGEIMKERHPDITIDVKSFDHTADFDILYNLDFGNDYRDAKEGVLSNKLIDYRLLQHINFTHNANTVGLDWSDLSADTRAQYSGISKSSQKNSRKAAKIVSSEMKDIDSYNELELASIVEASLKE